jgi:hypothetical protein
MTDERMYKILQDFAQSHTLSKDVLVEINGHSKTFTAIGDNGAKYGDMILLAELIRGAEHFMLWLRREGKARLVKCPRKGAKPSNSMGLGSKKRR